MSRPSVGSVTPHSPPLRKSRTVSQLPLHAAPEPSDRRTATTTSPMPMARDASGISNPPSWRTGACGAIRPASQMLTSAGTSMAAKPIPNSATCDQSLVVSTSRRPSASYHMTSVMRFTSAAEQAEHDQQAEDPAADQQPPPPRDVATGHRREGWPAPASVGPTGAFPCPRRWASRSSRCGRNAPDARRAGPRAARRPRPGGAEAPRGACRTSWTCADPCYRLA